MVRQRNRRIESTLKVGSSAPLARNDPNLFSKETQNPFSDFFGFTNPVLDFFFFLNRTRSRNLSNCKF